jgi:predicted glycosyltransferase
MVEPDGHSNLRRGTGRSADRPVVLVYCHHSVGLGHLVRSLAVAQALADRFHVVLASGGPVPHGLTTPPGVEVVALAPVGTDQSGQLTSLDPLLTLDQTWRARREELVALARDLQPAAVIVELFPFGRRKFAPEIIALLEAVRSRCSDTPVVCSVRDLLVTGHRDKQRHDDETAERLNRYFDAVIVHADPAFVRLEQTFTPHLGLEVSVEYSGFVCSRSDTPKVALRQPAEIVVSAGGGKVGADLLRAAVAAHQSDLGPRGFTTRLVTGPFLPEDVYAELEEAAQDDPALVLQRFVPDLCEVMAGAAVSVSQCGYNTAIDILRSGVPAVVVPFDGGQETEQRQRAERLAELGVVSVVPVAQLTGRALAAAILDRLSCPPADAQLRLDGASVTAGIVGDLVQQTNSDAGLVAS